MKEIVPGIGGIAAAGLKSCILKQRVPVQCALALVGCGNRFRDSEPGARFRLPTWGEIRSIALYPTDFAVSELLVVACCLQATEDGEHGVVGDGHKNERPTSNVKAPKYVVIVM